MTRRVGLALLGLVLSFPRISLAQTETTARGASGTILDRVGFEQRLNGAVPLDLRFRDESGKEITLGALFRGKPVILTPVYVNCPMLCTLTLNGLARALKPLSLSVGDEFDIITFSVDPNEDSQLSALKKKAYLARYDRAGAGAGWHFLTGERDAIEALTKSVGFRYTYNPETRQFAHAAGLILLTPGGRVAKYFFGIDYAPRDLQFGLIEATAGKVGTPIAKVMLLCYDYDAATGKYTLSILRLTRILGTGTLLALVATIGVLLRRERSRQARDRRAALSS